MHDVLVHYLEVNFPEIAEQLAHVRAQAPSSEERAAAAERLRELIRRLRRGQVDPSAVPHEPRASAAELIAGVNGELSQEERAVLDHFFELFARSMERTQQAARPQPAPAEPKTPQPPVPVEPAAAAALAAAPAVAAAPPTISAPVGQAAGVPPPPPAPAASAPAAPREPGEPAG